MTECFEARFSDRAAADTPLMTAAAQKRYPEGSTLRFAAGRDCRLLLTVSGQLRISECEWASGSCIILPPGKTVLYEFLTDCVLCEVSFQGTEQQSGKHTQFSLSDAAISQITTAAGKAVTVPDGCVPALYRTGLLFEILSCLPVEEDAGQEEAYGKQAMAYIRENYMRPISVNDVAAAIGVSRSWLYRCFMDYAAQSPAMYLRDVRMLRAKSLLQRTELPIREIAQAVGIDDPLYFSRVFSAYEGCSPSAYRNRL